MTNNDGGWAFASSAQLLQSSAEDTRYITHLAALLPSTQFNELLAPLLYYTLTKLYGKTLGEEHAGIKQVDVLNKSLPSKFRILIYITSTILCPKIMTKVQNDVLKITFIILQAGHTALFYWNGQYAEWIKRCLGLRYICDPKQEPFGRSRNYLHSLLVGITITRAVLEIFNIIVDMRKKIVSNNENDIVSLNWGQCSLCLQNVTSASVAKCGHVYCWYCIVEWLEMQPWCPLCRQACRPQQLFRLP